MEFVFLITWLTCANGPLCHLSSWKSNLSDLSWNISFKRTSWLLCLFPINFGLAICFLVRYLMSSCMFAMFDTKPGKILYYIMETRGISNCVAYTLAGSLSAFHSKISLPLLPSYQISSFIHPCPALRSCHQGDKAAAPWFYVGEGADSSRFFRENYLQQKQCFSH